MKIKRVGGEAARRRMFAATKRLWFGVARIKDIAATFGVSLPTASRILREADIQDAPDTANAMLGVLLGQSHLLACGPDVRMGFGLDIELGDNITEPQVASSVLKLLLKAMTPPRRSAVMINYIGRRRGGRRLVSPGKIVHILGRYHVRCWDHGAAEHKDFVMARIMEVTETTEDWTYPSDADWKGHVAMRFSINPELPQELRLAVAAGWRLGDDGTLTIRCRSAMKRYVVRRMTEVTSVDSRRWVPADATTRLVYDAVWRTDDHE